MTLVCCIINTSSSPVPDFLMVGSSSSARTNTLMYPGKMGASCNFTPKPEKSKSSYGQAMGYTIPTALWFSKRKILRTIGRFWSLYSLYNAGCAATTWNWHSGNCKVAVSLSCVCTHRKRQQARWIVKCRLCGCLSLASRPLDAWSKFLLDHVSAGVWEVAPWKLSELEDFVRRPEFFQSLQCDHVWSARFTVAKIAIASSRSVWQLCVSCRLQCPVSGSIFVRQFLQATYMGLPKTEVTCDAKKQCVRRFYKQTLLHTHTHTFTTGEFYTKTLLHADACTHRRFYTQTLLHKHIHTQRLLHTEAFTHRRFYTQKLLHRETFTHRRFYTQTLSHTDAFTHKHFYAQRPDPWNRNFTSVLSDRTSFRAKAFRLDKRNRNFTSGFGDRTLFRAKRLRRIPQNRNFTSVFDVAIPQWDEDHHFGNYLMFSPWVQLYRKYCVSKAGNVKWFSNFIRVAPSFSFSSFLSPGSLGSQVRIPHLSGHCRASTASSGSQWALPGLNCELRISVGTAGPQPRGPKNT